MGSQRAGVQTASEAAGRKRERERAQWKRWAKPLAGYSRLCSEDAAAPRQLPRKRERRGFDTCGDPQTRT
eukprot:7106408-Pyramimonas_sp.AAC.1